MVLQLLKHNRTATCWGGALLGLGRSQWTLTYLAVGQKAHKPWASLLPHCNQLWEPIQIANHELTGISGESRAELEYILLLHFFAISFLNAILKHQMCMQKSDNNEFRKILTFSHKSQWTWKEEGNWQEHLEEWRLSLGYKITTKNVTTIDQTTI